MTKLEMRIAIAEACGYEWYRFKSKAGQFFALLKNPGKWMGRHDGVKVDRPVPLPAKEDADYTGTPNFPEDLNAMHEAESVIGTSVTWSEGYIQILQYKGAMKGIRATALQRAEAFLRTLELWKEPIKADQPKAPKTSQAPAAGPREPDRKAPNQHRRAKT